MRTLITGAEGLLGGALMKDASLGERLGTSRRGTPGLIAFDLNVARQPQKGFNHDALPFVELAFLCAGTKGFAQCEGNREAFLADVDGNLALARHLLALGTFVVYVSTDGVETLAGTAYARNHLLVETALVLQPNVGIFRPGKFGPDNAAECARACADVGLARQRGVTRWPCGVPA